MTNDLFNAWAYAIIPGLDFNRKAIALNDLFIATIVFSL